MEKKHKHGVGSHSALQWLGLFSKTEAPFIPWLRDFMEASSLGMNESWVSNDLLNLRVPTLCWSGVGAASTNAGTGWSVSLATFITLDLFQGLGIKNTNTIIDTLLVTN